MIKPEPKTAAPPRLCDICMEDVPAADALVDLCSDDFGDNSDGTAAHSCPGCFCKGCAKQYVEHVVKDGYDGACPQVKCPACPGRIIPSSKWTPVVEGGTSTAIGDRAMKLLSLQCSGCHQRKSLMIGHDSNTLVSEGADAWRTAATTAEEQLKTTFGHSYKAFVIARAKYLRGATKEGVFLGQLTPLYQSRDANVDPSSVADPIVKGSPQGPCDVVLQVIRSITDPERRATFHVAYLRKFPEVWTRCHQARHCFRCHINGFHDGMTCAEYQMSKATVEDIVPCPQCGVSLTKGDGCSSVNCLCGKNFDWNSELKKVKGALAKLFEETMQKEAEEAALAKYETELALRDARMLEADTAGEAAAEETKEERGAAETKEPDDAGRDSDTSKVAAVLQVWKEAVDQSRQSSQPSPSTNSPEVLAAMRIQRSFFTKLAATSASKLKVAMASKVDPIPKPVVEKLSKEALADKAALIVYEEGSGEVHARASAWVTTNLNDTQKARSRMWAKRYPGPIRCAAANYQLSLKLPANDREMLVVNGWTSQNQTAMSSLQKELRNVNMKTWKAMYPELTSTDTRKAKGYISAVDRAYIRQKMRPAAKSDIAVKALKAYGSTMGGSLEKTYEHIVKAEHARAWDYTHQKPAGIVVGACDAMLDGIDWPANTALSTTELEATSAIKRALGGETPYTLYTSWVTHHGGNKSSRLNSASAERWVRLTSPALLDALNADFDALTHDANNASNEQGAKATGAGHEGKCFAVDVTDAEPDKAEIMLQLMTMDPATDDVVVETLKAKLSKMTNESDTKGGKTKGRKERGGRRQRSRSLMQISSTRDRPATNSTRGSWYKQRLAEKHASMTTKQQSEATQANDEKQRAELLSKHTNHLGASLPFDLMGKGPVELAVDVEVADRTRMISPAIFLKDKRLANYYASWKRGDWRKTNGEQVLEKEIIRQLDEAKAVRWEKVYGHDPFEAAVAMELQDTNVGTSISPEMAHYLISWRKLHKAEVEEWKAQQWEAEQEAQGRDAVAMAVDADVQAKLTKPIEHGMGTFNSNFNGHEVQLWGANEAQRETFPKLEGPFSKAVLKLAWCDQGWGNRKGHLHARVDGGKWRRITKEVAPHHMTSTTVEIPIELCGRSGLLELGYEVGGGGGHALNISSARLSVTPHVEGSIAPLTSRHKAYLKSWRALPAHAERMEALRADRWVQINSEPTDGSAGGGGNCAQALSALSAEEPSVEPADPHIEDEQAFERAVRAAVDVLESKTELAADSAELTYHTAWMARPSSATSVSAERARRTKERRMAFAAAYESSEAAAEAATFVMEESKKLDGVAFKPGTFDKTKLVLIAGWRAAATGERNSSLRRSHRGNVKRRVSFGGDEPGTQLTTTLESPEADGQAGIDAIQNLARSAFGGGGGGGGAAAEENRAYERRRRRRRCRRSRGWGRSSGHGAQQGADCRVRAASHCVGGGKRGGHGAQTAEVEMGQLEQGQAQPLGVPDYPGGAEGVVGGLRRVGELRVLVR